MISKQRTNFVRLPLFLSTALLFARALVYMTPTSAPFVYSALRPKYLTTLCSFFTRVDRILRRSLGVSETAPTDSTVKPAPPVAPEPLADEEISFEDSHIKLDPEMLGLKVGEPVLEDEPAPPAEELKETLAEEPEAEESVEEKHEHPGHDEL